jgi:hypothetical protein
MFMPGYLPDRHAELVSASIPPPDSAARGEKWTLKQVQGDGLYSVAPSSNRIHLRDYVLASIT